MSEDREQPVAVEPGQVWRINGTDQHVHVNVIDGCYVQVRDPRDVRPYWITITLLERDYTLVPQAGRGVVDRMEPRP